MRIAICLKQVPDTAEMHLDPVTHTLIREGVESILNPLDEFPLEAALLLREQYGGTVTALCMGPPQAGKVLQKALATGADEAILVSDRKFAGSDTWTTSLILARALEKSGPFDLVLCGKQAIDGDTAQVGPGLAAHLRIPQITYVKKVVSCGNGTIRVERLLDTGTAILEVTLPAVLSILKEANEPRLPTLDHRLRAMASVQQVLNAAALGLPDEELGLAGSPTRVVKISVPQTHREQIRLNGAPTDIAREFIRRLGWTTAPTSPAIAPEAKPTARHSDIP